MNVRLDSVMETVGFRARAGRQALPGTLARCRVVYPGWCTTGPGLTVLLVLASPVLLVLASPVLLVLAHRSIDLAHRSIDLAHRSIDPARLH